jgi:hypothetical protein
VPVFNTTSAGQKNRFPAFTVVSVIEGCPNNLSDRLAPLCFPKFVASVILGIVGQGVITSIEPVPLAALGRNPF